MRAVKTLIEYTHEGTPPTSNNAYFNRSEGGRALTDKARAWQNEIYTNVKNMINVAGADFREHAGQPLGIEIRFHVKNPYKQDWDGLVKLCQDATMMAMDLDDKYIVDAHVVKRQDPNPHFDVWVWRI